MDFKRLVEMTGRLPCFTTSFLAAGQDLAQIRLQLSRWCKDGRVLRLHKGVYTLAEPYRKVRPEPFAIAQCLQPASYISLQSALGWYGLIPEHVPAVTSITLGRPRTVNTPLGSFLYRHVQQGQFFGYQNTQLSDGQTALIALREKALLDLVYLVPKGDSRRYISELRLQHLDSLNRTLLEEMAARSGHSKLRRAVRVLVSLINNGEDLIT